MPHQDWCGNPCADCKNHCKLDERIPCSPGCPELSAEGVCLLDNPCDFYLENQEPELSDEQIVRIDEVENATFDYIRVLVENENMDWNMEYIGELADMAAELLTRHGFKVRYPAIVTNKDGSQTVEDYCCGIEEENDGQ